ncbi:MAG: ABC transporter ATP-binding protein, partial [Cyclobacteriaceae bacterium]|nr:ABC transporter ATP-binding protein [Cyclobacteriaceae bacterium]
NPNNVEVNNALLVLRNEINYELKKVGMNNFSDLDKLVIGKFDSTVYSNTSDFLIDLKRYYSRKHNTAMREKEELSDSMMDTPEKTAHFKKMQNTYRNRNVEEAVKNKNAVNRIVEYDGRFIQKWYAIFNDEHKPEHFFDFTANMYQPSKYFAGYTVDTYYFNIAVIWIMTVFFYITLYFNVLRKVIVMVENRRFKKPDRG